MQGGFPTFFHFFYCVRFRGFMACFVSYIYMFALLREGRVFLQLWLSFIDKDIARAYGAVVGGCGRVALRRLLGGANFRSGTVRVF